MGRMAMLGVLMGAERVVFFGGMRSLVMMIQLSVIQTSGQSATDMKQHCFWLSRKSHILDIVRLAGRFPHHRWPSRRIGCGVSILMAAIRSANTHRFSE